MSRTIPLLLFLLLLPAACEDKEPAVDTAWLRSEAWNDGKAVVSVFSGRVRRYGIWREAKATDYLIREFLDPDELTKRDAPDDRLLKVIKANRHLAFNTGTYDYRLMYSLFLERETGRLAKIVGSSQEGCGLTFKRWDRLRRKLSYDSYWEGEGRGERDLPKEEREFFLDELGYVGALLDDGARIVVYPSLLRNKVGGFEGVACSVERAGRTCTVKDEQGGLVAEYVYDADGFLERWRIDGGEFAQEFERVSKTRLYYWEFTKPGDAKKLEGK